MSVQRRFRQALLLVAAAASGLTMVGSVLMAGLGLDQGFLRLLPPPVLRQVAPVFERALVTAIALGSVLAGSGALGLSWWLSRALAMTLSIRLQPFVVLSRRIARGDLGGRVSVQASDELGELAYALNRMAETLSEADRQRETFLAAVAHDLRTPLTALQANLEGMLTGVVPPEPERIAPLHGETGRLIRLVEDLLTLASARAGALPLMPRPTDVAAQTRALAERFQPLAAAKGVHLGWEVPPKGQATVDPDRMDAVLTNLLSNAIRHVPAGGHVLVRLRLDAGIVEWIVSDDGPGIPPEILPHVTEPFVRGDPARGREAGSGLGLAIADTWVRAHGGTLHVQSDHGTRVAVRLPRSEEAR